MTPALFRRREVWWPTPLGLLSIAVLLAAALFALGVSIQGLLAPQAPARGPDGAGARTLVVEGWLGAEELDHAIVVARRGRYERIVTSGGPIEPWIDAGGWGHFALRAAAYLREHGPAGVPVIAAPAPETAQERTYVSAVAVREWARQSQLRLGSIDVLTAGVHARRSWLAYRMAFGDAVEVGIVSVPRSGFDGQPWWRSSSAAKVTLGEAFGLVWVKCCFWPDAPPNASSR